MNANEVRAAHIDITTQRQNSNVPARSSNPAQPSRAYETGTQVIMTHWLRRYLVRFMKINLLSHQMIKVLQLYSSVVSQRVLTFEK